VAELEHIAARIKEKIASGDAFEIMKADRRFYQLVWEATGNATLYRTLDQLTTPLFAFLRIYQELTAVDHTEMKPHEKLIEAMRTRDNDAITAAVKEHIEGSHKTFLELKAPELSTVVSGDEQQ
jgi:DNA-binding GntR family transcriptional regulator